MTAKPVAQKPAPSLLDRFFAWLHRRPSRPAPMKHPEYLAVHVANAGARSALR